MRAGSARGRASREALSAMMLSAAPSAKGSTPNRSQENGMIRSTGSRKCNTIITMITAHRYAGGRMGLRSIRILAHLETVSAGADGRTSRTGSELRRTTSSATLPRSRRRIPVRPWVAMAIVLAPIPLPW